LVMLGLAWLGSYLSFKHRLAYNRPMLWLTFLSFPLPFIAIITGWFTAEVGRQPWVVYGVLRTADAVTPFLTTRQATISLVIFCAVYAFIFLFGTFYIYRLIRNGPARKPFEIPRLVVPNRPMSLADEEQIQEPSYVIAGE
jgi:cytochrome bd ubiquinol oxidase subunit I